MKRIIVIGAGPAGMMAAIKAAEQGGSVLLLERMERAGRKMRITGKGRCNVTNAAEIPEILKNIPGNGAFLNSSLRAFSNRDVMQFFENAGVPLKVERGGRVFPASDRAEDAVNAMLAWMHELSVDIRTNARANEILASGGHVTGVRLDNGSQQSADAVVLATGGASYPGTGSSGDGYRMAKKLGHSIAPILPALVPLETEEEWPKDAQGLSLRNVKAALLSDGKKVRELFGEMLFTHFGVSGPIILSLSREASLLLTEGHLVELSVNLKPALRPEQLDQRIQRDFAELARKQVKNALHGLLPSKLIPIVMDLAYLDPEQPVHQVRKKERQRLAEILQRLPLTIRSPRPIAEAIVTAGGVSVKEIQPKTMESKLIRGLYFAGEVVDVDALTGGYNLQAAFSMGAAAGTWSAKGDMT